jgi:hypothetical protein
MTVEQKHLTYLDKLRESGVTNMYGARPYLERKFSMQKAEADEVLTYWMDNFNPDGTALKGAGGG